MKAKVGDIVRHFSNPEARATVVIVQPARDYARYGHGSWHDGAFMSGSSLLCLRWPDGHLSWEFGCYFSVVNR